MFKSVLVIIFVTIIFFIARTVMQRLKKPVRAEKIDNKDTVQCIQCKTYIPSEDAIFKGNQSFCSQQHLSDWDQ